MKILICSDSHTRLDIFQKVVELEEPEIVIFGGDHSTDAIDMSLAYRDIQFVIVKGNTDYFDYETKDVEIFEIENKKYLLTHGHLYGVKGHLRDLEKLAKENNVDYCIFGHTHRPLYEVKNGITFINPGAMQDKKYAILENGKLKHKQL